MSSVSSVEMFSVYVSSELNRQMVNVSQEVAIRAVKECGKLYNFDGEEAVRLLGLHQLKLSKSKPVSAASVVKEKIVKASFPFPFNGENNDIYCQALRQNNGLYTQCQIGRKGDAEYCKSCQALADKSENNIPEYGTISQRMAVDIFEYVDPKGRKPVAYKKIMKKYKLNEEQVLEEGKKLNITINAKHFEIQEETVKRGRPAAAKKEAKEPKGAKGRPKKEKKVLAIEGDEDDLFANLVANAQDVDEESVVSADEEKDIEDARVAAESKAVKDAKVAADLKAAKAQAKEEEKAAKALVKEQEKQAKEQKLAEEKLAKEQAKEQEKLAKEQEKAQKAQEKALAAAKKEPKVVAKKVVEEDEEEPDIVKKIEVDGKKYLKSKKTGIIYDYNEYVKNGEQLVVGKWNETKNKIEFTKVADSDEESEDEIEE
jgi:colicin import membrane protein